MTNVHTKTIISTNIQTFKLTAGILFMIAAVVIIKAFSKLYAFILC